MTISPRPSRAVGVAVAVGLAVALTGCSMPVPVISGTATPDADPKAVGLHRFYAQQIDWGACVDYATSDDDRRSFASPIFECGRLEVPLDYAHPDGRTAQVAVLRHRATGPRIGSLVFNPGGPGGSGTSLVVSREPGLAASPLSQRFDLVGFDPRGVGASTPQINCLTDADRDAQRARNDDDPSPAGVAATEQENRDYVAKCVQNSGAEVLANSGTRDVVKDLDILRAALGDAKLSYLGYSYGTRIGSAYAEAFPQNVRAMVLDGAIDPAQPSSEQQVAQITAFQHAFEAYASDCAMQPDCPLGPDPLHATARFQQLTRPLLDTPLVVGTRKLSYQDAVTGTIAALYQQSVWPILTRGLTGLAGGDGSILMALADLYDGRSQDGRYNNEQDAFRAVSCLDEQRITDHDQVADIGRRAAAAAPFADDGRGVVAALDPCAFWPVPATMAPHAPDVAGLPPTVVVSTVGDPATPYQAGVDLARGLDGELITYQGTQHTIALEGNACVDDAVTAYLIDLKAPRNGLTCAVQKA